MKIFPAIVLGIFVALAMGAVFIFSTYSALKGNAVGSVMIWGSLPAEAMKPVLESLRENNDSFGGVIYEFTPEETLVPDLIAAIASGRAPDAVFFDASHLLSDADKLVTIPYASYSRREFQNTFLEAGEVFLTDTGIQGLPFVIDPLVMYWNRGLFSSVGISAPPRYWDEVSTLAPTLSTSNSKGTLTGSAVSFGTWQNVRHAKAILLSLLRQLGNPVVAAGAEGYESVLEETNSGRNFSADSALRFYTDFADPVKPLYSWNISQPDSRDAFLAGSLAMYFGRASELYGIRVANPNLNFDVALVPSIRGGGSSVEADITALSIPRGAQNPNGALIVAIALTSLEAQKILTDELHLPSVLRSFVPADVASDPYSGTFRNAALSSFSFLDPNPTATDSIFWRMVEGVSSGKATISEAVADASKELNVILGAR